MSVPTLDWTVMLYMAAPDQGLAAADFTQLDNLAQIGSTEQVHIVAQLDTLFPGQPAQRFFIANGDLQAVDVEKEPNTGSIDDFVDFVRWVKESGHLAKKYIVVLNGHAEGVKDFPGDENIDGKSASADPSELAEIAEATTPQPLVTKMAVEGIVAEVITSDSIAGALAMTATVANVLPEILPDEDPRDALTNRELKEAIVLASQELGVPKIDIVGMDACLMSMAEIACQISEGATLMVASEQTIPTKSWPYANIVKKLIDDPSMTPAAFSQVIVDEYISFYELPENKADVSLSVCDLSQASVLTGPMSALATALGKCLFDPQLRLALIRARFDTTTLFISEFVDLVDFCNQITAALEDDRFKAGCTNNPQLCAEVKAACQAVIQAVSAVVTKSRLSFPDKSSIARATGLSIYFPLILPIYRELDFCVQTSWDEFLSDYMEQLFVSSDTPGLNGLQPAPFPNNGALKLKGVTDMSSHPANAPARVSCVALLKGTEVTSSGKSVTLKGLSFLDMDADPEKRKVTVPADTVVEIPGTNGVKASSGTELKSTPGTRIPPLTNMIVPACTLRQTGVPPLQLADGSTVKAQKNAPIVLLEEITVVGDKKI